MSKIVKEEIIKALASGAFISGQSLADELGVSRAAISNHINNLSEMGLDIFRVRGKGYKLASALNLLDRQRIISHLSSKNQAIIVEVHSTIDSTNNYLLRRLPNRLSQGQVCIAEYQSSGRGRRGRQWISPFGSHMYLSLYRYLEQGMSSAMGLSLVTALAISDTLKHLFDIQVELKWPNDVYIGGVKLAGILIDLEGQAVGPCHSVIGMGINLNMPDKYAAKIDQPWTDLQSHVAAPIDRNKLAGTLINYLLARLEQQQQQGLSKMIEEWHQFDLYLDKPISLITGEKVTLGICRGINEQGALLIESDGSVKATYGGEVSVRGRS